MSEIKKGRAWMRTSRKWGHNNPIEHHVFFDHEGVRIEVPLEQFISVLVEELEELSFLPLIIIRGKKLTAKLLVKAEVVIEDMKNSTGAQ